MVTQARIDAHLEQCFICDRRLGLVREANVPSNNQEITAEDIAIVRRVTRRERSGQQSTESTPETNRAASQFSERLTENLQQLCASLRLQLSQATDGGTERGEQVWRWQGPDRWLESSAILERTGDLIILLWSSDPAMEGVRLEAHLGALKLEVTMQRVSGSEFGARLQVARLQHPKELSDISIAVI